MTTTDHETMSFASATTRPRVVAAALNRFAGWVGRQFRAWKNRREIYRLGEMTDAQLADIGLVRGDLHVAYQVSGGVDPTSVLGTMAQARRREIERGARLVS
ncbi:MULTISPECIES: DUF1127 domain-containing protein [Nitratireductor]|uniref:DUF1127 domain-containing protein n=1 Tax=Nitratireductor TaxID=245876 RepID=UPI000D0E1A6A|nr:MULTISPECIES: DUF1127 domain-containing protein [Nitratireductor]PSM18732.1 hypothetical protein C7T96_08190 [Nitratireductor sp. StC3]